MPDLEVDLPDEDARWLEERAAELGADVGVVVSLLIASVRYHQRTGFHGIPAHEFAKLLGLPADPTLIADMRLLDEDDPDDVGTGSS